MKQRLSVPLFPFFLFRTKPNQRTHAMNKLFSFFRMTQERQAEFDHLDIHKFARTMANMDPQVVDAELKFLRAVAVAQRVARAYDERATQTFREAWGQLSRLACDFQSAQNGSEKAAVLRDTIFSALAAGADPSVENVRSFVWRFRDVLDRLFNDGPSTGFALLTALVEAGYEVTGEEIDAITKLFHHQITRPLTGAEWLATRGPGFRLRLSDAWPGIDL